MSEGSWTEWTPEKEEKFLKSLVRTGGNVSAACRFIRVVKQTAYNHRKDDPEFAAKWDEAIEEGTHNLEQEVYRRAFKGVKQEKGIYYQDKLLERQTITEYSDTLAIFLLKARDPAKYREIIRQEHSGPDGGPVKYQIEYVNDWRKDSLTHAAPGAADSDDSPGALQIPGGG